VTDSLTIAGCGAVTAVGLNVLSTCAAIRAHVSGFSESRFFHQAFGAVPTFALDGIVQARVPLDDPPFDGGDFDRLVKLAALALRDCVRNSRLDPSRTAVMLGVRDAYRVHPDFVNVNHKWIAEIESVLRVRFHSRSEVIAGGHVSVFQGLLMARHLLRSGEITSCIVGGVDSYLNDYDLQGFVRAFRILGPKVSRGFVPGEGAAFLALEAPVPGSAPDVRVMGVGIAKEDPKCTVLSDGHPTGRGLEQALDAALGDAGVAEARIDLRISDQNGETYRTDESLLAAVRFYKTYRQHLEIWHPADCVGDIGAASGAMLLILGWAGLSQRYAPGAVAMCESSSDSGDRAACVIARIDDEVAQSAERQP
jgi:3-oxoacyl-[acyl-carrier-protein] synthase-1